MTHPIKEICEAFEAERSQGPLHNAHHNVDDVIVDIEKRCAEDVFYDVAGGTDMDLNFILREELENE